ncbi:hypothetical protein ACETRX_36990, partial [Labrys portucalensis]
MEPSTQDLMNPRSPLFSNYPSSYSDQLSNYYTNKSLKAAEYVEYETTIIAVYGGVGYFKISEFGGVVGGFILGLGAADLSIKSSQYSAAAGYVKTIGDIEAAAARTGLYTAEQAQQYNMALSGLSNVLGAENAQFVAGNIRLSVINYYSTHPDVKCFAFGTPILLASGRWVNIEDIKIGDIVSAFDPSCRKMTTGVVKRLYRNVTQEFFVLRGGVAVTRGHLFLNELGEYEQIGQIVSRKGSVVRDDGSVEPAIVEEVVIYNDDTRSRYQELGGLSYATSGGIALAPEPQNGWCTYNFEVEGIHAYVAGGYCVHNDSSLAGDLFAGTLDAFQALALGGRLIAEDAVITTTAIARNLSRLNIPGAIGAAAAGALDAMSIGLRSAVGALQGMSSGLGGAFGVMGRDISAVTTGLANAIGGPIGGAIGAIGGVPSGILGGIGSVLKGIGSGQPVAHTLADLAPRVGTPDGNPSSSATPAGYQDLNGFYHNTYDQAEAANRARAVDPWLAPTRNTGLDRFNPAGANPAATDGGGLARTLGFSGPDVSPSSSVGVGGNSSHGGSSSSTGGANQGSSGNPGNRQDGNGSRTSGRGSAGSQGSGEPVILDLDGDGLRVTPLSSSTQFIDDKGDSYQTRTAWAGKGDGVLIFDADHDGKLSNAKEFAFTEWDSTAKGDL